MVQPLVSIIMSVYKANPFWFLTAFRSAIAQTYPNIEVIIVYVEDYIEDSALIAMDDRFHYNNEKNIIRWVRSPVANTLVQRTLGLKEARGKYTRYLDSDDFMLPTCIEAEVNAALSTEAIVISAGFFYANMKMNITGMFKPEKYDYSKLMTEVRNYIPDCSLTDRRLYDEIGYPRYEEVGIMCYFDQWLRAGEQLGEEVFHALRIPTWIYRFDDKKDRSKGPEYDRNRQAHTQRVLSEAYFRTGGVLKK